MRMSGKYCKKGGRCKCAFDVTHQAAIAAYVRAVAYLCSTVIQGSIVLLCLDHKYFQ